MAELFSNPVYRQAAVTAAALGVACALLSVLVVLRQWAFIGEGISHAGFGGVGTAWLLSLALPFLGNEVAAYAVAVLFCLGMAAAIGWVARRQVFGADAAIGIVLVASLAWGFVALKIYDRAGRPHGSAGGWEAYLLGDVEQVTRASMLSGLAVSAVVVILLAALWKEVTFYCMDPDLAEVSGVRAGPIHYLLMLLLALVIVVGMRLAGYLLVTALLVLPGATALLVTQRLGMVVLVSAVAGFLGTVGGLAIHVAWRFIPTGPAMVLVLVALFAAGYVARAFRGRAARE